MLRTEKEPACRPHRARASTLTGADLRQLRQAAHLTTTALASLLDCHPATVRALESDPARKLGRGFARTLLLVVVPGGPAHVDAALAHAIRVLQHP